MGTNFVRKLVDVLSSGKSQGNLLMKELVGLIGPLLLVLAMLINQLGDRRTVRCLERLDLLPQITDALMMSIKTAPGMGVEEAEARMGILELAHRAGLGVDVVAALPIGSAIVQAGH